MIDSILLVDDENLFHLVFEDACSLLDISLSLTSVNSADDAEKMLTFGFVFLGMPGFITTVLSWFGRSSSKPWKPNWFTRFGGLATLVIGFLIVRGVLLG